MAEQPPLGLDAWPEGRKSGPSGGKRSGSDEGTSEGRRFSETLFQKRSGIGAANCQAKGQI